MTGTSSFNLAGTLTVATSRRSSPLALSQVIGEVEAKSLEINVPYGGTETTVPLGLSSGVTEALIVAFYSAEELILELESSDSTEAGPIRLGIKGHWIMTLSPDEGITSVKAVNPSTTTDRTLEYVVGSIAKSGDTPEYWDD